MAEFEKIRRMASGILAVGLVLFTIYTAIYGIVRFQRPIHLAFILCIAAFQFPILLKDSNSSIKKAFGIVIVFFLVASSIITSIWGVHRLDAVSYVPKLNNIDVIMGILLLIVTLEIARRTTGFIMPLMAIIFLAYAYWGDYFPGEFFHKPFSVSRIIYEIYPGEGGFYGAPIGVCSTFIILFITFGSFLNVCGGTDIFIEISNAIAGNFRGGPAKVAVIGSGMMGMISGSAVANVATTGQITIPLMKRVGFRPNVAGAIEAIASTGGQLMPPIMGATAFIIADLTGVAYIDLCFYAFVPAALFYYSLFLSVHHYARHAGIQAIDKDQLPKFLHSFIKGIHLLISIAVLVVLLVLRYSIMMSVVWALVTLIACSMTSAATRVNIKQIIKGLELGAINMVPISAACAVAGIIIGIVNLTGIGYKLSYSLVELSQGIPIVLLLLVMVISIVLSMGLPPIACYIILIILVGPALEEVGFNKIASHLFVFYFVVLSVITPPYCLGSYTAASIAGGDPFKTGFTAMKYGLYSYVLPFAFIYFPQLLLQGSTLDILTTIARALFSIFCFEAAMEGFLIIKITLIERFLLVAACYLIYHSDFNYVLIAFLLLGVTMIYQIYRKRKMLASSMLKVI